LGEKEKEAKQASSLFHLVPHERGLLDCYLVRFLAVQADETVARKKQRRSNEV